LRATIADLEEVRPLLIGLDAFGDSAQLKGVGLLDDRAREVGPALFVRAGCNEGAVQFQYVNWQRSEV
jgi:hypothetical protein